MLRAQPHIELWKVVYYEEIQISFYDYTDQHRDKTNDYFDFIIDFSDLALCF